MKKNPSEIFSIHLPKEYETEREYKMIVKINSLVVLTLNPIISIPMVRIS